MNVLREQRDYSGLWHKREAFAGNRCEQRGLVAETEEHRFAGAACLKYGRKHGTRGLREVALRRKGRAEIRKSLDRPQKPPKIVFLRSHAGWEQKSPEHKKSNTQPNRARQRFVG